MQPLKEAMRKALKGTGIDKAVLQNKSLLIWPEVVGEAVAKNATAEEVRHGILIVKVSTPVWRNELSLRKEKILENLNRVLGEKVIRDIRLV